MLLEQEGQVDLGREERRRDRTPERDHRRQPTSYDERAGGQQRPHGNQHHHQRDRGGGVAERASRSSREVEPHHGDRDHRRQRQPATGGGPPGFRPLDGVDVGDVTVEGVNDEADPFPAPTGQLITIDDTFGGWGEANEKYFGTGEDGQDLGILTDLQAKNVNAG